MTKRAKRSRSASPAVSPERAARLYRLLQLLAKGPQSRATLLKRLRLDVRGFYRDLELLRLSGIVVSLHERRYALEGERSEAVSYLPFPDPRFSLGDAIQLAKGRTQAHQKLREQIAVVTA